MPERRQRLKGLRAIVVIALAFAGTAYLFDALRPHLLPAPTLEQRVPAAALPQIRFEDGEGRSIGLESFRGRVVLLNVWATWCPPCRDEMPALDTLQARLGGPDFAVVPISTDLNGAPTVRAFYERLGIRALAVYVDPSGTIMETLRVGALPTTVLIDRDGREVGRTIGPADWNSDEARALILRIRHPGSDQLK